MPKFTGIWPALVTPLDDRGRVNAPVVQRLVDDLLAAGVAGFYICGSTGEGVLLSAGQRQEMAEVTVNAASGRVPVMVHVGSLSTEVAVVLTQHAALAGAEAVSAIPPFYYDYPFSAVLGHYRAIADASELPLYLYHMPASTGVSLSAEQLLQLCSLDGVAGLKYTSRDLYTLVRILGERDPERLNVLAGSDEVFLASLALGVDGAIGTTYNFMPRLYVDILQAAVSGDYAAARALQYTASRIIESLLPFGVIPATKALLTMLGYPVGQGVAPLARIEGEQAKLLHQQVEAAGLWEMVRRGALHPPAFGDAMQGRLA